MPRIDFRPNNVPKDFQFEVRRGNVPGLVASNQQGHADGMGTSFQGLWGNSANISDGIESLYDTPAKVKVASTSTDDDAGGTGALTVLLGGVDSSGVAQTETITLDGQTEVESANTYKGVTTATTLTSGSGNKNAGDIWVGSGTFTSGVPAVKNLFSEAGDTIARSAVSFVAANHKHWVIQLNFTIADTSKALNILINTYDGSMHRIGAHFAIGAGNFNTEAPAIGAFAAGTIWWITGKVGASTADVTTIIAFNDETL